jgi:MacB-like periplasmic core domain
LVAGLVHFPDDDGVQLFRGRFYNAKECKPNANIAVVVTSYGFWKRNRGRRDFVGSTLHINGQPYTVSGIAPDGFSGANALIAPDIWLPFGIRSQLESAFGNSQTTHDLLNPKNYTFNLTARLRTGLMRDSRESDDGPANRIEDENRATDFESLL